MLSIAQSSMKPLKLLLYRPAIIVGLLLGLILSLTMALLISITWRNLERINTVDLYVSHANRLQQVDRDLQSMLMRDDTAHLQTDFIKQQAQIAEILMLEHHPVEGTQKRLREIQDMLSKMESKDKLYGNLVGALNIMQQILDTESREERALLDNVIEDTALELRLAMGVPVTLLFLLLLGLILLRRSILNPLNDLRGFLVRLAEGEFRPVETENAEPLLQPLLHNYNHLVIRLAELEQAHKARTRSLESEVRTATRTLLEQSRSLAHAERLAAVGEVAARMAHELRNPLAGIQVALTNMRKECRDSHLRGRFDLIMAELQRLAHRLSDLLAQSRHTPEPPQRIDLAALTREVVTLMRYQIADTIDLHICIKPGLEVHLPETGLRQALINLIINAAQALAERPGHIAIAAQKQGKRLLLSVSDNGPGFPPMLLTYGIRPFASYREQGTGLGLLMVQRFVRSLNGEVKLTNLEPHGACVTLRLPAF